MFPDTPQTLLRKIAELAQGDDRAEWEAFVELYAPPLRNFIRTVDGSLSLEAVDDAVQDVLIRLVEVLRKGEIDRTKGKFRAYLASMTRRLLIDRYRESLVRPLLAADPEITDAALALSEPNTLETIDPGALFDVRWRLSVRQAAIEHVMTKTAISEQSRRIYEMLEAGLSPRDVAARLSVSRDVVKQVKSRVERAITAVLERFGGVS